MKLCTAVQEGCGYKDTLRAHRYFASSAKYFTVCITYQPPIVISGDLNVEIGKEDVHQNVAGKHTRTLDEISNRNGE